MGAAVGEAVAGKKAGNKAALWGGICGTIPDLDVVAGQFMDIVDKNEFHRSISHSLLFFVVMSPIMGFIIKKIHPNEEASVKDWSWLAFWAFFTHALLDSFTTWGTQLFWPLGYKVAFKSIFVIDPVYTLPFLILLILALLTERDDPLRRTLNWTGIAISSFYLVFTLVNKQIIDYKFEKIYQKQGIAYDRFETKPAPLNNILWSSTAETKDGYYLGYYSFFDKKDSVDFLFFPKKHNILDPIEDKEKVVKLKELTDGWYTVEKSPDGIIVNDLRFGTVTGWRNGGQFVFSYLLEFDPNGELTAAEVPKTMEQGGELVGMIFHRMLGNKE